MKSNELLRLLTRDGWTTVRQSGSHVVMEHPLKEGQVIFPNHGSKEVKKGLLNSILKQAQIKTSKR
jgi:predicted RNA binding protein YcfA (HicA-like mRNA interferase family)